MQNTVVSPPETPPPTPPPSQMQNEYTTNMMNTQGGENMNDTMTNNLETNPRGTP